MIGIVEPVARQGVLCTHQSRKRTCDCGRYHEKKIAPLGKRSGFEWMRTKRKREKLTFSPTKFLQLNSITDTGFKLVGTTMVFDLKVTAVINRSMMKWGHGGRAEAIRPSRAAGPRGHSRCSILKRSARPGLLEPLPPPWAVFPPRARRNTPIKHFPKKKRDRRPRRATFCLASQLPTISSAKLQASVKQIQTGSLPLTEERSDLYPSLYHHFTLFRGGKNNAP